MLALLQCPARSLRGRLSEMLVDARHLLWSDKGLRQDRQDSGVFLQVVGGLEPDSGKTAHGYAANSTTTWTLNVNEVPVR